MENAKNQFALRFSAKGLSLEKLLKMAGENNIALWGLKRQGNKAVTGQVAEKDFPLLLELAQTRGWEIEKGKAIRLSALRNKLLRRWGIGAGALVLVIVMVIALQFVWHINILDAGAYEGDIRAYLEEAGIKPGMLRSKIDIEALNAALEYRYPETAWVKTAFRGADLTIRMIQGVPVPKVVTQGDPNDIIASQSGIIVSIEPYQGTPQVQLGDLVKKGQVLIKGEERAGTDGETKRVKARGKIMAKVWLGASVRLPLFETVSIPTGLEEAYEAIETPFVTLFEKVETAFEHYDIMLERWPVVGAFFPVTLKRITRMEVSLTQAARDVNLVKQEAGAAAYEKLAKKMAQHDDLIDKWVDYCMIEGKQMEATAVAQVIRDIAVAPDRE